MKAWTVISVELLLLLGGEWWLIGDRSDWRGWVAAMLALAGLTALVVGLRALHEAAGLRSMATAFVGVLITTGAIWLAPSWQWVAAGAWAVVLIVAIDRVDGLLRRSDPSEPTS